LVEITQRGPYYCQDERPELDNELRALMQRNLCFNKDANVGYFLCAELSEEDLPVS
jgi:hypothetical protein